MSDGIKLPIYQGTSAGNAWNFARRYADETGKHLFPSPSVLQPERERVNDWLNAMGTNVLIVTWSQERVEEGANLRWVTFYRVWES